MNDEWENNWTKARNLFNVLRRKAESIITKKTEKLIKATEPKDLLLKGAFKMQLTSSDGYVLIWSRRHYTSSISYRDDYGLDLTLISPQGDKMYDMSWGCIRYPKYPKGFDCSVLDEYTKIASEIQFTDVKIVCSNGVLSGIGTFCGRYLGITEESYQPEIVNYYLFSPYESSTDLKVNEYLINHHVSLKGKKTDEIKCYWNGNTINQTRLTGHCGWYDASQSLIINCDEGSFLQINTSQNGFEVAYLDRTMNLQRKIKLAIGGYLDECNGRLKEFSIVDNDKEILHVSYKKSEVVGFDYEFDIPMSEKNNVKRTYEAVFGSESVLLNEKDASFILYHSEIKDFILFAIKMLKEKLPNLADRMFKYGEFSRVLRIQLEAYEKGFVPNDIACDIVEKATKNGLSSEKILKLKR